MAERLIIDIQKISEDGSTYEGQLPPEILDLAEDKFIQPEGTVDYALTAQVVSDQLIVQGTIETQLRLCCVRCAEFFSTTVQLSSFLRAYTIQSSWETIDLSDDIREEILLMVPYYPKGEVDENEVCKECGKCMRSEEAESSAERDTSGVWDSLNQLQVKRQARDEGA